MQLTQISISVTAVFVHFTGVFHQRSLVLILLELGFKDNLNGLEKTRGCFSSWEMFPGFLLHTGVWYVIYSSMPNFIWFITTLYGQCYLSHQAKCNLRSLSLCKNWIHPKLFANPQQQQHNEHCTGYLRSQDMHRDASSAPRAVRTPMFAYGPKDLVHLDQAQVFCSFQGLVSHMVKNQAK